MIKNVKISEKDKEVLASAPKDPLIDLDDPFDYSKVFIEKPWGYEYSIFKNKNVDVWFLFIKPGHKTSVHCHPHKKTSLLVVGGIAAFSTLNETAHLKAGDGFVIDKGVFHSTEALSSSGAYVLESETPVNKKNLVRIDDIYGRSGKRYESGRFVQPRNPSIMHSFYEINAMTEPKNLGECHVIFVNSRNNDSIFSSTLDNLCAAVVLKGAFVDSEGETIYSPGEVIDINHAKSQGLSPLGEVELLLVKRSQ